MAARPPGVILAGGEARRLGGGDKPLRLMAGRTLLARIVARLAPQCAALAISANGDPLRFADTGLPVLPDGVPGRPGPLAGILAAMDWAAGLDPGHSHVLTVPGDVPFLPSDLAARLADAAAFGAGARLAFARSGGRGHPVVALWPVAAREDLRHALESEGLRKVGAWTDRHPSATVDWPVDPIDPFFNVNTPDDMAEAERLCAAADPH